MAEEADLAQKNGLVRLEQLRLEKSQNAAKHARYEKNVHMRLSKATSEHDQLCNNLMCASSLDKFVPTRPSSADGTCTLW